MEQYAIITEIPVKRYSKKKLCDLMDMSRDCFNKQLKALDKDPLINFKLTNSWYLSPGEVKVILDNLYY